ncbi:unnamed protein product [Peniophora sp. CBMAI 1063]|nr:unnamed protein product [Peniophora sp. CBMAI 1063]
MAAINPVGYAVDVRPTLRVMMRVWDLVNAVLADPTRALSVSPILPLLHAIPAAAGGIGGKPDLASYPTRPAHHLALHTILQTVEWAVLSQPEAWDPTLDAVSLLFQLYTDRAGAVLLEYDLMQPVFLSSQDFVDAAAPMDRVVDALWMHRSSQSFVRASRAIIKFQP